MNIYVGNLSFQCKDQELIDLFENYGEVVSVKIISDKYTGKPRGFAFVEMEDDDDARDAIEELHETEFLGRNIIVNEARDKRGGGGGGRRGGGGGGGYNKRY